MNPRFDRNRFLIGTYCLAPYARTDAHVRALKDAGIDFLCAAPAEAALLDLCQKHNIGMFATHLPGWGGWLGANAGKMAEMNPIEAYEAALDAYADHPAVWGLDVGDEPCAADLPHMGRIAALVKARTPHLLPYMNLYPNYGAVPENTPADIEKQLGTGDYAAYLDAYIACVNTDYLCFDYYMYDTNIFRAYENMALAAEKCRASGRDMWVVLQVNSKDPAVWQSENRLRHQAYAAMAYGARAITWACWTAGWWHNNVLDDAGAPTEQYGKLQRVNREIRSIGDAMMPYRTTATRRFYAGTRGFVKGLGEFYSKSELLIGEMTGENGKRALLLVNISDPYDFAPREGLIRFTPDRAVNVTGCTADISGGTYEIPIPTNRAALLTWEE